uniref:CLAVATA3/ESR-like protein n=3 Tax=Triticinae TaxID=1648030 RepID=A0A453J1N6_AEGTS
HRAASCIGLAIICKSTNQVRTRLMMRLLLCLCICFVLLLAGSSPDSHSERCPLQHRRQLQDVVVRLQATAAASTAAAARPRQEGIADPVYGTSKRLSPGGSNPQHHR